MLELTKYIQTDTCTSAVKMVPANIVAYVSSDYRWGFVLSRHIQKFSKDISNYEISCIPVPNWITAILGNGARCAPYGM